MNPRAPHRVVTHHRWVLAGDVGGTKVSLASFLLLNGGLHLTHEQTFKTAQYPSFESVLSEFTEHTGGATSAAPAAACFGMAGVVENGRCQPVNYPWVIEQQSICQHLQTDRVALLNDLQATAYGCLDLDDSASVCLNAGQQRADATTMAVIAAGTGLGEALIVKIGSHWKPIASEGGHANFAPSSPLEDQLLSHLRMSLDQVSNELLLSGRGISLLYQFMRDQRGFAESSWLTDALATADDPAAVITETALAGASPLCAQTLELFVRIYGAEAGNLALKAMATGGVLIGGGIAPKILPFLRRPAFMEGFCAKSRIADFMRTFPVRVLLDSQRALWGAAAYAAQLLPSA